MSPLHIKSSFLLVLALVTKPDMVRMNKRLSFGRPMSYITIPRTTRCEFAHCQEDIACVFNIVLSSVYPLSYLIISKNVNTNF